MYPTMEVRWFWQGELPWPVRQWFESLPGAASSPDAREDWYLWLPATTDLGIKQRQGKLEIKKRWGDRGIQAFTPTINGRVEHWLKWDFELNHPGRSEMLQADAHWIAVNKIRSQKHYALQGEDQIQAIGSGSEVAQGCSLEITNLSIDQQHWSSVGLEAFGTELLIEHTLNQVVRTLFDRAEELSFEAQQSFGYPAWLNQVGPKKRFRVLNSRS